MNYFAHGYRFVDRPYFLAGTAIPDWLGVVDRGTRVRSRQVGPLEGDPDERVRSLAAGIRQHHEDDAWFHRTAAFSELSLELTAIVRAALSPDEGFRPSFLGHILVELLLDAALIAEQPARLAAYYQAMQQVEPALIEQAVNRVAAQPTQRLAAFITPFCDERFLWDYSDDGKLLFRLNQVMRRVSLTPLPAAFRETLAAARPIVAARVADLLAQPSGDVAA